MKRNWILLAICCFLVSLLGCANNIPSETETAKVWKPIKPIVSGNQLADSLDRAVVQQVNNKKQTITFYNLVMGKSYTLTYDSSTGIKDRFDQELVAMQLEVGDICMVSFLKESKEAKNIWLDKAVSKEENLTQFEINRTALWVDAKDTRYAISEQAVVLKDGKALTLRDINEADTITAYMEDHTIYSFVITNEHGYVRLEGAESFVGGFVEFTQFIIRQVEEDMLIVLPSGSYDMKIAKDDLTGTKHVDVLPGEETIVDVSDFVSETEQKMGNIIFTITPSDAKLQLDGKDTDYSKPVSLSYGVHQMVVSKEGYQTITEYIKVGQEVANLNVEMEKTTSDETEKKPETTVSSNTTQASIKDGYQVYIDAPSGSELYVDGKYKGLIPTSFEKKKGSCIVSVRKNGYTTRSYSLDIDDSKKDLHYSFSELELSE